MLAFEELLRGPSRVARRGRARGPGLPEPAGAGRVSRLRGRGRAHGRADQPAHGHADVDAHRALGRATTGPARWPRCRASDVLLVNPVRDGLNLVAKEGPLLNGADGVLVLSAEAGAWEELSAAGALGVNPFDVSGTAEALHAALTMPADERARRASSLRAAVRARSAADWWDDQLAAAGACRPADARRGPAARRRRPGRAATPTAPAAPRTVEVGLLRHLRRALGVDHGHADRRPPASRACPARPHRLERRQVAEVVAEHRDLAQPPARSSASGRTTVPLSTSSGGRSSSSIAPASAPQAVRASASWRSTNACTQAPRLGSVAPVQRDGQALGLHVDARGRVGVGPPPPPASITAAHFPASPERRGHARARRGRPARRRRAHRARRARRRWAGPRSPPPRRTRRPTRRAARAHRGAGRAPTGSSTMADSVPSKSRKSALCAGSAASACSGVGSARAIAVAQPDFAAMSCPTTTTTSVLGG